MIYQTKFNKKILYIYLYNDKIHKEKNFINFVKYFSIYKEILN